MNNIPSHKENNCTALNSMNTFDDDVSRLPMPPEPLRWRVTGNKDPEAFLKSGKSNFQNIKSALGKIDKDLSSFKKILDFGCGCGRVIRWFLPLSKSVELYGTDYDYEAIEWCRNNLTSYKFNKNKELPPLDYTSNTFDFIYAISIFTHLNEEYQFQWLKELKRISKQNCILFLTTKGKFLLEKSPEEIRTRGINLLDSEGFFCTGGKFWKGTFPEYFSDTFHTKEYIIEKWSKYFHIIDYIPRGMAAGQDIVILNNV